MKNFKALNPKLEITPKLEILEKLSEKYVLSKELDQTVDELDIMHFQSGLLFCITHDN